MSELVVKSGSSGNTADVNDDNELQTFAVTRPEITKSAIAGDAFFISHTPVNLTSANQSYIFSILNNEGVNWIVDALQTSFGESTGGSGKVLSLFTINGTTGTLFTSGTPELEGNQNLGSPKTLDATIFSGAEGFTVTNGISDPEELIPSVPDIIIFDSSPIIIAPSTSIQIAITPPTGNTSMDIQISITLHRS